MNQSGHMKFRQLVTAGLAGGTLLALEAKTVPIRITAPSSPLGCYPSSRGYSIHKCLITIRQLGKVPLGGSADRVIGITC